MDELKELLRTAKGRIDEIAGDIRDLKEKLKDGGMSAEDVAAHKAELAALVESLTGVAALHDPAPAPEPVPEPEPAPEPAPEPTVDETPADTTEQPE